MLHKETVSQHTMDLIQRMMHDEVLKEFNLVGGTALALMVGHRLSIDIDLFSQTAFDAKALSQHLNQEYNATNTKTMGNGVFCFIEDVKIDMLAHQYPLINPVEVIENIRMLSLEDIGAMKINAITGNGTRLKDYVDMYTLLERFPLKKLLDGFENKYPNVSKEVAVIALNYHLEIRPIEIQFTRKQISLEQITKRLSEAVHNQQKIFVQKEQVIQEQKQKAERVQKIRQQNKDRGPRL
ncbi:MAG: nucleotidyl transferase AbiEii/AbiGii toxin family protein [Bacteroidota bacterium]